MRRFELLTRVRIARHFGQLEGRRRLARVRLLAFYVLFQSSPSHDDMMAFFVSEAEFVSELVGLLQARLPPAWKVGKVAAMNGQNISSGGRMRRCNTPDVCAYRSLGAFRLAACVAYPYI